MAIAVLLLYWYSFVVCVKIVKSAINHYHCETKIRKKWRQKSKEVRKINGVW